MINIIYIFGIIYYICLFLKIIKIRNVIECLIIKISQHEKKIKKLAQDKNTISG